MRQEHSSKKTSDRETDIKNVRYMATRTHFFDIRNIFSRNDIETALLRLRNKSEHNGGVPSLLGYNILLLFLTPSTTMKELSGLG